MNISGMRIAILGTGNIGAAIARGVVSAGLLTHDRIILTRRHEAALQSFAKEGFGTETDNARAVAGSDLIFIAVTPQHLNGLLASIRPAIDPARHTIVSIVSGATIAQIRSQLGVEVPIIRAMPNTAIAIRESMTCLAADKGADRVLPAVRTLFEGLGKAVVIEEDLMVPATALCACGIAFFLRAVRAASQGGIEIGFHADEALLMAAQTARGAASLLVAGGHPEAEVDKVTTPQGCTISGLNQMEHNGFSSALIKGIVSSAEKAAVLYAPKPI
ncbi:MAG: pyrroline-5-carboxylate reductase [Ignavibacteriae bacterium]|nr:pyrroline-5-carboxylate reductase [Ignavibacteriota bacterium]